MAETLLPFNRQGSANAIFGNLLTLPVGGGLVYVQPIYTQTSATTGAYPALRFVVVRFGEHVGIGETLQQALDRVFQGDAGAETGEDLPPETPIDPVDPGSDLLGNELARQHMEEAVRLKDEAEVALRDGDLGTYQLRNDEAMQRLEQALEALEEG